MLAILMGPWKFLPLLQLGKKMSSQQVSSILGCSSQAPAYGRVQENIAKQHHCQLGHHLLSSRNSSSTTRKKYWHFASIYTSSFLIQEIFGLAFIITVVVVTVIVTIIITYLFIIKRKEDVKESNWQQLRGNVGKPVWKVCVYWYWCLTHIIRADWKNRLWLPVDVLQIAGRLFS